MEIRPSLAETFNLQMHIDGFDATIEHLPQNLSGLRHLTDWLSVARLDLLVTLMLLAGIGYVLLFLYVFTVLPELLFITLLMGLLGIHLTDTVIDGLEPASRRISEAAIRTISLHSRLRIDASRLWIGGQNWRLSEIERLSAHGSVISVELHNGQRTVFVTSHIPWECARLCELLNVEIARHRAEPPQPPEALRRVIGRAGASRSVSLSNP